jgi:pimeloyl-ACP methyl ester carboxylesterase
MNTTFYRTLPVDGLNIFYREAGPKDGPTLLLLHGFPSSSRMFDPLFPLLGERYHLGRAGLSRLRSLRRTAA